jgi:hypothetical protein
LHRTSEPSTTTRELTVGFVQRTVYLLAPSVEIGGASSDFRRAGQSGRAVAVTRVLSREEAVCAAQLLARCSSWSPAINRLEGRTRVRTPSITRATPRMAKITNAVSPGESVLEPMPNPEIPGLLIHSLRCAVKRAWGRVVSDPAPGRHYRNRVTEPSDEQEVPCWGQGENVVTVPVGHLGTPE